MTTRIAIIPARGGSVRLPRKNILPLLGRPLICWTIGAARQSGLFDRVLVSTDDTEIAQIARDCGAEVPFLRAGHADGHSPSSLATLTALDQAEAHWDQRFDVVAQLLPTCPLRSADDIKSAVASFDAGGQDAQISVFEYGWMNPWWAMRRQSDGRPEQLFPDALTQRSQDLDRLYCPSGAIWLATTEALRAVQSFYTPAHVIAPIPWQSAVDIDDAQDLRMAEIMLRLRDADEMG